LKLTYRDYIRVQFHVTLSYLSLGRSEIKTNRDSSRVPCVQRMAGDQKASGVKLLSQW
jgi:hypothetical protein